MSQLRDGLTRPNGVFLGKYRLLDILHMLFVCLNALN
jgi:hypothetical protein